MVREYIVLQSIMLARQPFIFTLANEFTRSRKQETKKAVKEMSECPSPQADSEVQEKALLEECTRIKSLYFGSCFELLNS